MKEYYNTLEYQLERTRKFRHDIEKHMNVISELILNKNEQNNLKKYVTQIEEQYHSLKNINYCGNPVFNAIFLNKQKECENREIELKINIKKFNIENIREMDLIAVISEIIEYAMFRVDKVQPVIEFNCGNNLENLIIDVEYKAVNSNNNKDKLTVINSVVEKYDGAIVVNSIEEAVKEAEKYNDKEAYVIGGGSIYEQMLPYCDTAYVTYIDNSYSADTFIPNLDKLTDEWYIADESDECTYFDIEYYFRTYKRKK